MDGQAFVQLTKAASLAMLDRVDEAQALRARCRTFGPYLADAVIALGRVEEGLRYAAEGEAYTGIYDFDGQLAWRRARARALAHLGRTDDAIGLIEQALPIATDALVQRAALHEAAADVYSLAGRTMRPATISAWRSRCTSASITFRRYATSARASAPCRGPAREGDRTACDERTSSVAYVRVLASMLLLVVVGCGAQSEGAVEPPPPPPPSELVLAGDGEMWVVDVAAERARHVEMRELSPGDPAHRVLRRGDRFVFWGYATYATAEPGQPLDRIAEDTWFFIPSAHPERVWVTVLDPRSPATRNGLKAVREITVDGHVTVPDVEPPGGGWPQGAVTSGLLFHRDRGWSVWDPRSGRDVSRLELGGPLGPTHGDTITSCAAEPCDEVWFTAARTGERRIAHAPEGKAFQLWAAEFSPDGRRLAAPVNDASASPSESPADLALVDVASLETQIVPGSTVSPYYVFTAWSAAGDRVFITGGERFRARTVVAYGIGDGTARTLAIEVGDFYDIAAR